MKKTLIIILSLLLVIVAVVGLYINNTRKLVKYAEKNNKELSVDFLKSANEELIKENKALIKENKELKKKIEELESRALINPRKVTDEQVKKIKELRASGLSYRAIVKEIGLSTCTIQRALKGIYD